MPAQSSESLDMDGVPPALVYMELGLPHREGEWRHDGAFMGIPMCAVIEHDSEEFAPTAVLECHYCRIASIASMFEHGSQTKIVLCTNEEVANNLGIVYAAPYTQAEILRKACLTYDDVAALKMLNRTAVANQSRRPHGPRS